MFPFLPAQPIPWISCGIQVLDRLLRLPLRCLPLVNPLPKPPRPPWGNRVSMLVKVFLLKRSPCLGQILLQLLNSTQGLEQVQPRLFSVNEGWQIRTINLKYLRPAEGRCRLLHQESILTINSMRRRPQLLSQHILVPKNQTVELGMKCQIPILILGRQQLVRI